MTIIKLAAIVIFTCSILVGGATMIQAESLNSKQAAIIPIAAFTANGDTEKLEIALAKGLENGLTVNEIKEILVQMYAYAGFPRSLTGLSTFMNLISKRKQDGINDPIGESPKQLPPNADRNAIGTRIQTKLVGAPVKGPLFEFAPAIDAFLKEHLFCDIFDRGVLTDQERELATIAALAALPAPQQLAAHLNISINTGLTEPQLQDYIGVMNEKVGKSEADLAAKTLDQVLARKK